jgi:hypothetical protein
MSYDNRSGVMLPSASTMVMRNKNRIRFGPSLAGCGLSRLNLEPLGSACRPRLLGGNIHSYSYSQDRQLGGHKQNHRQSILTHDANYLVEGVGAGVGVVVGKVETGGVAVRGCVV